MRNSLSSFATVNGCHYNHSPSLDSPKIQIPGAHVDAYPRMNRHAETIMRFPMFLFSAGSLAVPAAAKTKSHADCQRPPIMRGHRRPL